MPFKGDDMDSKVADQVISHLANSTARITPSGVAHPSVATACVNGIFKLEEYESMGSLPVFVFKTDTIRDPLTNLVLIPKKLDKITIDTKWARDGNPIDSKEYTVQEAEVRSADMTALILKIKLA